MPDAPVAPAPVKPGYATTEFWIHILVGLAICLLTKFEPMSAGLPSWAQAAYAFIAPLALAWLAKNYSDGRVDVKTAGAVAAAAVTDQPSAAAVLRGA